MPGWHEATQHLQEEGRLQMLGIVEEQHPERARLFMQWKEMGWPILVDAYDLLEVELVPVTLAIDEHGVIRHRGLRLGDAKQIESSFLDRQYGAAAVAAPSAGSRPPSLAPPSEGAMGDSWREHGDALATWGGEARLDDAVDAYERALALDAGDGWAAFRLGVALRKRYEGPGRRPGDFQAAVDAWSRALEIDPNNYVWRRRIQQYGPSLDKPYPFYEWVEQARREIAARGETPVTLGVEPRGSELAKPARELTSAASDPGASEPDPRGRVHRDDGLIDLEATMLHLVFRPVGERKAHWNNEVDPLAVWLEAPAGWESAAGLHELESPAEPITHETRRVEVEVRAEDDVEAGPTSLSGYALYYVCEDVDGTCLYRRQDFSATVRVRR